MAKRTFRWDATTGELVEVASREAMENSFGIVGELAPFISPITGEVIRSKAHLRDHMAKHDVEHYDPTRKREYDRYDEQRKRTATRELMWEAMSRIERTGRGLRDNFVGPLEKKRG